MSASTTKSPLQSLACSHFANCHLSCNPKLGLGLGLIVLIIGGTIFAMSNQNVLPLDLGKKIEDIPQPTAIPSAAISPAISLTPPANFSEIKALKLANVTTSACTSIGSIGAPEIYNPNSQTWWFTLIPNQPKSDCHPACVVHLNGQVEVNWRCTGLKIP